MRARRPVGRTVRRAVTAGTVLALAAALVRELRQPAASRTWHGRVAGIPYDFRPPTPGRVREVWWDPTEPHLVVPRAFGLGWAVNLGRVATLLRRGTEQG